jgi:predicted TPR repeat methyltransferase
MSRNSPAATKTKPSRVVAPVPAQRELDLTLPQAIEFVRGLLANGKLASAEHVLNTVLGALPDEPDALHLMGALRDLQGRTTEALSLIDRSIVLKADDPGRWNDLGNVLAKLKRRDDALVAYNKSVSLAGDTLLAAAAYNNLGSMHVADDLLAAERCFRRATELQPDFGHALYNLSQTLIELGRVEEGVDVCGRAIILMPQNASREHVARAYIHLGRTAEAIAHYQQWLSEEPDNPVLQHHLAALMQPHHAERASDAYVESVFDRFAGSFDAKLADLGYCAPEHVRDAMVALYPNKDGDLDVADAGCGTGLCGPLMKPWAKRLSGFDLSSGMLGGAEARNVYSDLHKAELVAFLDTHPGEFDVVISADTLCYFGQLHDAMRASAKALRPNGHVIFTVEALDDDSEPHRLLTSGRYSHSLPHVSVAATSSGLRVESIRRVKLRAEAGRPVIGWLVTLHRP